MDFFQVKEKIHKDIIEIYPDFNSNIKSFDLMIKNHNFYAIWDDAKSIWSTDEYDVYRLITEEVKKYAQEHYPYASNIYCKTFESFDSGILLKYNIFLKNMMDNYHTLNTKIIFENTKLTKKDYASYKLSYNFEICNIDAYNELMDVLYDSEERRKLEWAIGSIIAGDSQHIQKFIVLYGEPGSGKSTFLNILYKLFEPYCAMFDAKMLVGTNNTFSTDVFRKNPLVAIQHDGDLSKIEDNTKLNSIISHEVMMVNEKYKNSYELKMICFLFMGTNQPVKITNIKSGLIRRLIDVRPSGNKLPVNRYNQLMNLINYQLGGIAVHCYNIYKRLGKNYYNNYKSQHMILETNIFYNFVEEYYFNLRDQNQTTLAQAYAWYIQYCSESNIKYLLSKYQFREELKSYFNKFLSMTTINNKQTRNVYREFKIEKFKQESLELDQVGVQKLNLESTNSNLDKLYPMVLAQYANEQEIPILKWEDVQTKLSDLDTKQLHYVQLPLNHIVLDFDLKNEQGEKSKELNLIAAAKWPPTYAEFSKSGNGVHLHYIYNGDVSQLSRIIDKDIEVKVFVGKSALRRKLTFCNNESVNLISSGLPIKEKKMISLTQIKSEQGLRKLILRNLNKEIHASTKSSIDFIYKILEEAYADDSLIYNLNDMRNKILQFAMNSTNNSEYCVKIVNQMKFTSKQVSQSFDSNIEDKIVFFDVEVFPNLFIVVYKVIGEENKPVVMINPTPLDVENLIKFKLVGFNNRRYDNHILYGRFLGYSNEQLYELSQKIINDHGGLFGEAYNLSYTDIYDFSSERQSLKKWEIELGIHHKELEYKWDQIIPEDKWQEIANYCINDVIATERVFFAREADWIARQLLADLAEGSVNDTTNQLATKIIFGNEKHPDLIYTNLATGEQY